MQFRLRQIITAIFLSLCVSVSVIKCTSSEHPDTSLSHDVRPETPDETLRFFEFLLGSQETEREDANRKIFTLQETYWRKVTFITELTVYLRDLELHEIPDRLSPCVRIEKLVLFLGYPKHRERKGLKSMEKQEKLLSALSSITIRRLFINSVVMPDSSTGNSDVTGNDVTGNDVTSNDLTGTTNPTTNITSSAKPRFELLVSEKASILAVTQTELTFLLESVIFCLRLNYLFIEVSECSSFGFLEGFQCKSDLDYLFLRISSSSADVSCISGEPIFTYTLRSLTIRHSNQVNVRIEVPETLLSALDNEDGTLTLNSISMFSNLQDRVQQYEIPMIVIANVSIEEMKADINKRKQGVDPKSWDCCTLSLDFDMNKPLPDDADELINTVMEWIIQVQLNETLHSISITLQDNEDQTEKQELAKRVINCLKARITNQPPEYFEYLFKVYINDTPIRMRTLSDTREWLVL